MFKKILMWVLEQERILRWTVAPYCYCTVFVLRKRQLKEGKGVISPYKRKRRKLLNKVSKMRDRLKK